MKTHVEVDTAVDLTPRVRQMAGLFDVPLEKIQKIVWDHDLPIEDKPWNIGLVVGPSGAGKSVMANHLWPGQVVMDYDWPAQQSILDGFPREVGIKEVTGYLTSVGLGSPPAWMRPYRTLSMGEKFRATIARALAQEDNLVVIDEFTSVVDRQVAQVASHTVQKAIRRAGRQLVAVSCHYDIEDWLQPDWAYDVAAGELRWRSVQPHPPVELAIHKCPKSLWRVFARHHYLSHELHGTAVTFAGYVAGRPVAFVSYRHFPHPRTRRIMMAHRFVVLPDWQGLGIASRLCDWMGQYLWDQGYRFRFVIAHPAMIRMLAISPRWRETSQKARRLQTSTTHMGLAAHNLDPRSFGTRSFEYTPPKG